LPENCSGFETDSGEDLVKRLTMLVTAKGEWVFEDSVEFFAALGDSNPDYDSTSFAVKNLGFIKFQILDDSIIEIELHPRNVELPALLAVQQQLLSSRVNLFRIKYFETSWRSEITFTAERAISYLSELCAPVFAAPANGRFLAEPRDFSRLLEEPDNGFCSMVQKWRMSFGFFDSTVIAFAIKQQLLSRMMIVGVTPQRDDPIFRFIGDGFPWTDHDYKMGAIGRRIDEQPDKEYGAWVSEFYKFSARTGQPRYDFVTAAIQRWPGKSEGYITHYERLLLPWKTPSEEVFVMLLSKTVDGKAAERSGRGSDKDVMRKLVKSSYASAAETVASTTSRSPHGDPG
jgi:hypothetical protein